MRHPLLLMLAVCLALFEAGNLTGFSWKRLAYVPEREIVDAAIRLAYPDIYADLRALQADYAGFQPQVRYWGSWNWEMENGLVDKLFGFQRYQVRLPEEIVIVDADGKALFSRADTECGDDRGCPKTPPDRAETGIVGTVQHGPPGYQAVQVYAVTWAGTGTGSVFTSGHCFSASVTSKNEHSLVVNVPGDGATTVRAGFGYHLVAITSSGYHALMRISRAAFERSRTCSAQARQAWPNVGGASWQR
jgi:hypothetical protein